MADGIAHRFHWNDAIAEILHLSGSLDQARYLPSAAVCIANTKFNVIESESPTTTSMLALGTIPYDSIHVVKDDEHAESMENLRLRALLLTTANHPNVSQDDGVEYAGEWKETPTASTTVRYTRLRAVSWADVMATLATGDGARVFTTRAGARVSFSEAIESIRAVMPCVTNAAFADAWALLCQMMPVSTTVSLLASLHAWTDDAVLRPFTDPNTSWRTVESQDALALRAAYADDNARLALRTVVAHVLGCAGLVWNPGSRIGRLSHIPRLRAPSDPPVTRNTNVCIALIQAIAVLQECSQRDETPLYDFTVYVFLQFVASVSAYAYALRRNPGAADASQIRSQVEMIAFAPLDMDEVLNTARTMGFVNAVMRAMVKLSGWASSLFIAFTDRRPWKDVSWFPQGARESVTAYARTEMKGLSVCPICNARVERDLRDSGVFAAAAWLEVERVTHSVTNSVHDDVRAAMDQTLLSLYCNTPSTRHNESQPDRIATCFRVPGLR